MEARHFFWGFPEFRSLRPLPKTDLEKNKLLLLSDEKSHGLRYTTRIVKKIMAYYFIFFRRFLGQGAPPFRNFFRRKVLPLSYHASRVIRKAGGVSNTCILVCYQYLCGHRRVSRVGGAKGRSNLFPRRGKGSYTYKLQSNNTCVSDTCPKTHRSVETDTVEI